MFSSRFSKTYSTQVYTQHTQLLAVVVHKQEKYLAKKDQELNLKNENRNNGDGTLCTSHRYYYNSTTFVSRQANSKTLVLDFGTLPKVERSSVPAALQK
jgi:hypothetical protein